MNTPDNWETFATIRPDAASSLSVSETATPGVQAETQARAAWWLEVFGGDRCPVKSILPHRANLPGHPNALVYEMDLAALTPEMRERLVDSIASRFSLTPDLVEFHLDDEGVPILADDVVVSTTNVGLLLPDIETITMGDGYIPDLYDFDEEQAERDEEFFNREIICETCGGVKGPEYSTCFCDDEDDDDLITLEDEDLDKDALGILWTDFEAGLNAGGWPDGDEDDDDSDWDSDDWEERELRAMFARDWAEGVFDEEDDDDE
jgi:hypothetical protein